MPEKKIQEQLDAQIAAKRVAQVVEVSEAPLLTSEIFERDARTEAIVVVNFRDESARLVESSDAPKLTAEVLKTQGKPVKTVEMFYEDQMWKVEVWDGKPLRLEVEQMKLLLEYEGQEHDRAAMEERDRVIANLLLGKMMVDPPFSYKGEGEGTPIENRSSIMIESLCNAYNAVNHPTERRDISSYGEARDPCGHICTVRREVLNGISVGGKAKKYVDMSEDELAAAEARNSAQRQVLVAKMILDPLLSYTPVVDGEEPSENDTEGYPVELLSERYMKTLFEGYRVTNIPDAGLRSLQRHFRSRANSERENEAGESVGDDGG